MASVLTTLGAQTNNSFSDYGAGTDYTSRYDPFDETPPAPLTGAIGDIYSRPIMFRYLQIYNTSTSTGAVDLQIATAATGGGGAQSSSIPGSDTDPDWNVNDTSAFGPLQFQTFTRDYTNAAQIFYYGFYKNDASRVYFNTSATVDAGVNPNTIYRNGTADTAFPSRVIAGRIGWYHVPNAPTSFAAGTTTSSTVPLSWTHPTDDGISDSLPGGGLYGYRIVRKRTSDADTPASWSVVGTGTSGSPSGTHYIRANYEAYNLALIPSSATVSGLDSNTNYDFKVAGLNLVTDRHNGAGVSIFRNADQSAVDNNGGVRSYGNYTTDGVGAHVGTNASITSIRTKLVNPTVSGSYTSTASVGVAYSSNVTWGQLAGGGAIATTLTYSIASGSLTGSGLSLNTSTGAITGTPTDTGVYTFTIRATNLDSGTATTATQTITIKGLSPKVWDGSAMVRSTLKVWNGTNWTSANPSTKVWDSTTSSWKYLQ